MNPMPSNDQMTAARIPLPLSKSRLMMLFKLWAAGYDNGYYADRKESYAGRDLVRLDYAAQDPSCLNHFRITDKGVMRLEHPMMLYGQARSRLRVVK